MPVKCGTVSGYAKGCRCDPCRTAKREWRRGYERGERSRKPQLRELSPKQRAYLWAFDHHLKAGDDERALEAAKQRTDAMIAPLGITEFRSAPDRKDWMDRLLRDLARLD